MFDRILSVLAPHQCLGCDTEGTVLCAECQTGLPRIAERCYHCRRLSPGGRTCRACRSATRLNAVHAATTYNGLAKDLVWKLKFSHARQSVEAMTDVIGDRIALPADVILVPVPTASNRIRQRGFDQAQLLARALSHHYDLPALACLARSGQARQVGATRSERLRHISGAFRMRAAYNVHGRHIVLVDDVLTTGATLDAAAAVLKQAGAKRVDAIVFAQA